MANGTEAAKGYRVFIVDDDPVFLSLYTRVLRKNGHFTYPAECAQDALQIIERGLTKIDLIITDVNMPGLSGLEFHQKVKERRPELADRMIFITGDPESDRVVEFTRGLPNWVLGKPFLTSDLLQAIESLRIPPPSEGF
ncbi:MAG TPA: response regulator [bacterium]|nr:response regulator [bacterium]